MGDLRSMMEGKRITLRDPETGELRKAVIMDGEVIDDGPVLSGERTGRILTMRNDKPEPQMAPELPAGMQYRYEVRDGDHNPRLECATERGALHWAKTLRNDPSAPLRGAHVWDRAEQRIVPARP